MAAEWIERLRSGSYTSPSGVTSNFLFDAVSRSGGKKASVHEVLNSNGSIIQVQGNTIKSYPMPIYFVGDNGDTESDIFIESLEEEYSPSNTGTLYHPRWGDLSVIPFTFEQSENYVNGAGIFRVTVEFKESTLTGYPVATGVSETGIIANVDSLADTIDSANGTIDVDNTSRYAEFKAQINNAVDIVSENLDSIASTVDDVYDEFRSIKSDIDSALAEGATAIEIMSMVNSLIRLPSDIASSTMTTIEGYVTMIDLLLPSFEINVNAKTNRTFQINNAVMLQSISSIAMGSLVEASLNTTFDTRDAAGEAIDYINDTIASVEESIMGVYQTLTDSDLASVYVTNTFAPDHNTGSYLSQIIAEANALLISRSFDLKARKTTIITTPIDALSLTYKLYGTIDKLEFLILSNKLTDNEILEIGTGREIVSYA